MSTVSGITAYTRASQVTGNALSDKRQGLEALIQALQAGDLPGAQKAFASIQRGPQQMTKGVAGANPSNDPVMNDWSRLAQSLQSADLQGAQRAFAQLQQDVMNTGQACRGPLPAGNAYPCYGKNTPRNIGSLPRGIQSLNLSV